MEEAIVALGNMRVKSEALVAALWSLRDHPNDHVHHAALHLGFKLSGNPQFSAASRHKSWIFQCQPPFDDPIFDEVMIVVDGPMGRPPPCEPDTVPPPAQAAARDAAQDQDRITREQALAIAEQEARELGRVVRALHRYEEIPGRKPEVWELSLDDTWVAYLEGNPLLIAPSTIIVLGPRGELLYVGSAYDEG